jgi:LuxR family maltose regulon positive regulatory protein
LNFGLLASSFLPLPSPKRKQPLNRREIGAELYLSVNTIKGYTKSLYRKLDAASRPETVRRGRQLGLI